MYDESAGRPLEQQTMTELEMLQRMARRYAELDREHAYLVGLVSLAVRSGDANLLASARERVAETKLRCDECSLALGALRQQMSNSVAKGATEVDRACEYAAA